MGGSRSRLPGHRIGSPICADPQVRRSLPVDVPGVSGWVPLEVSCALLAAVGWRERVEVAPIENEPPVADPLEFARQWAAGQFGPLRAKLPLDTA